jgi:hypothetical protein
MDIFEYTAVLTSIIIGLGIAHLLRGFAGLIQHPEKARPYWVHLLWVGYRFFTLVFWWWWEFRLGSIETWTFQLYLFIVFYALILFLASALLFPLSMEGYADFREYFYARRRWLFGLFALTYIVDFGDTVLKGWDHLAGLGLEYPLTSVAQFLLCLVAMWTRNERYHAVFGVGMFAYQVSWALRMFGTVS